MVHQNNKETSVSKIDELRIIAVVTATIAIALLLYHIGTTSETDLRLLYRVYQKQQQNLDFEEWEAARRHGELK